MVINTNDPGWLKEYAIRTEGIRTWFRWAKEYAEAGEHDKKETCKAMVRHLLERMETQTALPDYRFIERWRSLCNDLN